MTVNSGLVSVTGVGDKAPLFVVGILDWLDCLVGKQGHNDDKKQNPPEGENQGISHQQKR